MGFTLGQVVDELLDCVTDANRLMGEASKLQVNGNKFLDFGSEGVVLLYQLISELTKKGAKGEKVGDFDHKEIPAFLKQIGETKDSLDKLIDKYNKKIKALTTIAKVLRTIDAQFTEFSKDPKYATNSSVIKVLTMTRKQVMELQEVLWEFEDAEMNPKMTDKLDVTEKTKVGDLDAKLLMSYKTAKKTWENTCNQIDKGEKRFRQADFGDAESLVEKLASGKL